MKRPTQEAAFAEQLNLQVVNQSLWAIAIANLAGIGQQGLSMLLHFGNLRL